jgi:magnesium transporter
MRQHHKKKRKLGHNTFKPPGFLAIDEHEEFNPIKFPVYLFSEKDAEKILIENGTDARKVIPEGKMAWFDITSLKDIKFLGELRYTLDLNPLIIEDALHLSHPPKLEEFSDHLFLTFKALKYYPNEELVDDEHVNIVLGDGFVVSMIENDFDSLELIRKKIIDGIGKIRIKNPDYLFYRITDVIVDDYFNLLEKLTDRIERYEDMLVNKPDSIQMNDILHLKKQVVFVRRMMLPLRECIGTITIKDLPFIEPETKVLFRDVYDHLNHLTGITESMLEMIQGLMDLYMSNLNISLNNIMKILTIITALLVPLTFITGIYGMNFKFMPGLNFKWSFLILMLLMASIMAGMLMYMRKKKWF